MKQQRHRLRTAIVALSASIVLPIAPVLGQDAPAASPPPVVTVAPPPPVMTAPPPVATTPAVPPPRINIVPQTAPATRAVPPPVDERPVARTTRTTRTATRTATRAAPAPVRRAAPAPAPAPVPAPVAEAPAAAPAAPPAAVAPLPAPAPAEPIAVPVEENEAAGIGSLLPWLIGAALLIGALAFFLAMRRRRAAGEAYEEAYYEEPAVQPAPVAEPVFERPVAEPAFVAAAAAPAAAAAVAEPATVEEATIEEADQADVEALAADSAPVAGRPWLEFLLRPVRAGTSQDDAIVQFELTVGNTGTVAAKDVRISTWMFAAGATDMERMLIEPPADATVSEVDIDAGDGTRVEAEIALSKAGLHEETVLPVVVADARYRLPDGSEGRTSASFAVGLPGEGDELAPFQLDRATGLIESVEARLHGEPTRT